MMLNNCGKLRFRVEEPTGEGGAGAAVALHPIREAEEVFFQDVVEIDVIGSDISNLSRPGAPCSPASW
jgi:hypothetical protein